MKKGYRLKVPLIGIYESRLSGYYGIRMSGNTCIYYLRIYLPAGATVQIIKNKSGKKQLLLNGNIVFIEKYDIYGLVTGKKIKNIRTDKYKCDILWLK